MGASRQPKSATAPHGDRGEAHGLVPQVAEVEAFQTRRASWAEGGAKVLDQVAPEATAFATALLAADAESSGQRLWLACADARLQERVHAELVTWGYPALFLPRAAARVSEDDLPDPDLNAERSSVLSRWQEEGDEGAAILVLCADSLGESAPDQAQLAENRRQLEVGASSDPDALLDALQESGYERVPVVTERGQFARRGGIIDLFPWLAQEPVRIEWFGDEIDSIRAFDLHNQASVRKLERIALVLEAVSGDGGTTAQVRDYFDAARDQLIEVRGDRRWELDAAEGGLPVSGCVTAGSARDDGEEDHRTAIYPNPLGMFDASDFVLHETRRKQFQMQVEEWQRDGWRTVIFFHNEAERERFHELLELPPKLAKALDCRLALLYRGFTVPAARLAVLTGAELFGRHQTVRRVRGSKLDDPETLRKARDVLKELREGDAVVHADHGVGRYEGLTTRKAGGKSEEVLVLGYADQSKLFVPVGQAHLVSRYVGVGGKAPPLSKLGGAGWKRTRGKAQNSVEEFAARMLSVAAERRQLKGHAHPPDSKWQVEFEQSFLYRETPDQLRCVEEIKQDMEEEKPMDRLLCADVGFGKTEVAIRAAFKAVMGGTQVAILVPTTVLARQHYHTFRERMSEFPVSVEMLSRLTPKKREKDIVRGLADGSVDVVIGTHRLVSKDIRYKNLGLVVVDEEQRFGVKHKERFKELFRLVDVLTLSATPIPRTLYLSLMGMRDMSTIETPPPNKQAVETTVCPYDERIIRKAIDAELDRGGQVFFLHNRVKSIEKVARRLGELCPRTRTLVGHGQMDERLLEDVMQTFVEGKADVLVATTIIESGVDIPNANTILIDRADRFGLADLYQLRGRVGRAGAHANAYLMLPRDFVEGGDARKRVNAIKQYTGLGSGFKIALRDLEIRGAGNLLGTEQSGHIAAVGFDLYCQMLKQAVNKMQGRRVARPIDVALRADFLILNEALMLEDGKGMTGAYLPADFMEDPQMRIQAYRSLGEVMTRKELLELEAQWRDQFGQRLPFPVQNLLRCAGIRLAAARAGITEVEIKQRKLMLTRNGNYVMLDGKFPRLREKAGYKQLAETEQMLRSL